MTKKEILTKLNESGIPASSYSLGYEIKNLAVNVHTLPNGKYYVFNLDERGGKSIIETNIETEEKAFDVLFKELTS